MLELLVRYSMGQVEMEAVELEGDGAEQDFSQAAARYLLD